MMDQVVMDSDEFEENDLDANRAGRLTGKQLKKRRDLIFRMVLKG